MDWVDDFFLVAAAVPWSVVIAGAALVVSVLAFRRATLREAREEFRATVDRIGVWGTVRAVDVTRARHVNPTRNDDAEEVILGDDDSIAWLLTLAPFLQQRFSHLKIEVMILKAGPAQELREDLAAEPQKIAPGRYRMRTLRHEVAYRYQRWPVIGGAPGTRASRTRLPAGSVDGSYLDLAEDTQADVFLMARAGRIKELLHLRATLADPSSGREYDLRRVSD